MHWALCCPGRRRKQTTAGWRRQHRRPASADSYEAYHEHTAGVGIDQFDITQRRHLVVEAVGILAGHGATAFDLVVRLVGDNHAHLLERDAADRRAVVAGHAAGFLEQLVAGQFVGRDGVLLAQQPQVDTGVRRNQGLLEFGDGQRHLLDVDLVLAEDLLEFEHIGGNRFQHIDRQGVGEGHFAGVGLAPGIAHA